MYKEEIAQIRQELPSMRSTLESKVYDEKINHLIDDLAFNIEVLDNSLRALETDMGVYAIRFNQPTDNQ